MSQPAASPSPPPGAPPAADVETPRPLRLLVRIAGTVVVSVLLLTAWGALDLAGVGRKAPDPRDEAAGYDDGSDATQRNMAIAALSMLLVAGALPAGAVLVAVKLRRRGPSLLALGLLALAAAGAWTAAIRDGFDGSWGLVGLLLVYPLALGLALVPASLRHLGVLAPGDQGA